MCCLIRSEVSEPTSGSMCRMRSVRADNKCGGARGLSFSSLKASTEFRSLSMSLELSDSQM